MNWIKDIVIGLIETYKTRDIYELISALDISIIKKDFTSGKKASFFRDFFGNEIIYISPNLHELEERFILAHELGHAILHIHLTSEVYYSAFLNIDKIEFQADCFAAELLVDETSVDKYLIENFTLEQLSNYLGIPTKLVEYKLSKNKV